MHADPASLQPRLDRRTAIKWMLTAAAATAVSRRDAVSADTAFTPPAQGYGTDPDLLKTYRPGELWPLTFTDAQRAAAAALCDVIIPADSVSPSASSVAVHDFIDEWISSPYAEHAADRKTILEGLSWLDAESQRRFQNNFAQLNVAQQEALCSDISYVPKAKAEHTAAANFFRRYRDLTAGGFYTTPVGMKDIGYTGNVPLPAFPKPALPVLKKLGLA